MATVTLGVLSCVLGWLVLKTGHSVAATVSDPRPSVTMDTVQTVRPPGQQYNTSLTDHHTTTVISFGPESTNTSRASTSNRHDFSGMYDHEAEIFNRPYSKHEDGSSDEEIIRFWLRSVTVIILASLGLVGNLVAILVWRRETSFKVTVFLFQYLAGWDNVYLLFTGTLMVVYYHPSDLKYYVYYLANLGQLVSVHVTLVIAVTRWIAVTSPLHVTRLLPSKRIYLSCMLVFIYCVILETLDIIFSNNVPVTFVVKRIIGLALPLLLMLIVNLSLLWNATRRSPELEEVKMHKRQSLRQETPQGQCLSPLHETLKDAATKESPLCESTAQQSCSTEQMQHRHQNQQKQQKEQSHPRSDTQLDQYQQQQHHLSSSSTPPPPPQQQQLQEQQQQEHKQQQQKEESQPRQQQQHTNQQREDMQTLVKSTNQRCYGGGDVSQQKAVQPQARRQQMVRAVLLISLCSFIAYPVGVSIQAYAFAQREVLDDCLSLVLGVVPVLLHVLNSSINVVIYSLFVTRFRQLARPLYQRLRARLCCRNKTRASKDDV